MNKIDDSLTPAELVAELDRYIIGQHDAKRAVAIAIRNRWRRRQLPDEMRDEVMPKNIIMIGPTGVGKTEIARRLAQLVKAPFIKVEASKYTEVGYVGRDVESIIRDLVAIAIAMGKEESRREVRQTAQARSEERLTEAILHSNATETEADEITIEGIQIDGVAEDLTPTDVQRLRDGRARDSVQAAGTREAVLSQLRAGHLEDLEIEYEASQSRQMPQIEIFSNQGVEQMGLDFQEMFERIMPSGQARTTRLRVAEAREVFEAEEAEKLIDQDKVTREALDRVQHSGIVFIDELDKIAGPNSKHGPDVSREGVQRDLLPIVEGSSVSTRWGIVNTDHILFVAAGAFHVSKPSDLIPELQGRFPIRVELSSLSEADFVRILTEPQNALTRQYVALLATEGVPLTFTDDGIAEIARVAAQVNQSAQNIGARRLATVLEKILEDISFDAPILSGQAQTIDCTLVKQRLEDILADEDLSRYIL